MNIFRSPHIQTDTHNKKYTTILLQIIFFQQHFTKSNCVFIQIFIDGKHTLAFGSTFCNTYDSISTLFVLSQTNVYHSSFLFCSMSVFVLFCFAFLSFFGIEQIKWFCHFVFQKRGVLVNKMHLFKHPTRIATFLHYRILCIPWSGLCSNHISHSVSKHRVFEIQFWCELSVRLLLVLVFRRVSMNSTHYFLRIFCSSHNRNEVSKYFHS